MFACAIQNIYGYNVIFFIELLENAISVREFDSNIHPAIMRVIAHGIYTTVQF